MPLFEAIVNKLHQITTHSFGHLLTFLSGRLISQWIGSMKIDTASSISNPSFFFIVTSWMYLCPTNGLFLVGMFF